MSPFSQKPSQQFEFFLGQVKRIIPKRWFAALQPKYHFVLAAIGALIYRHPSRRLFVVAVTGTKGKSTTVELINAIFEEAGYTTAILGTIRFKIGDESRPNLFKMTVPGRFFVERFLRRAVDAGCTHAILEMSSEAAKQYRHIGIDFDALVFTNLAPEHLESHGGMEHYAAAKLSLAKHLEESPKRPRYIVANAEDAYGARFLEIKVEMQLPFSLSDAHPYTADKGGARFFWRKLLVSAPLPGLFNLKNILAAATLCEAMGIGQETIQRAVEKTRVIPGRAERIEQGQAFMAIVDYAHTPDSLRALYETFVPVKNTSGEPARRICVLGSTGGGRDTWKREAMGKIADEFCDMAILTDEDPYDEPLQKIIDGLLQGFSRTKPRVILNRRLAIRSALKEAREGDIVLISGKGTDPYIMRARGTKEPWSDKKVVEEELDKLLPKKKRRLPKARKSL